MDANNGAELLYWLMLDIVVFCICLHALLDETAHKFWRILGGIAVTTYVIDWFVPVVRWCASVYADFYHWIAVSLS